MLKTLLLLTILTYSWEPGSLLTVRTDTIWRSSAIYVNNDSIGLGTSPSFSYGKDRIAYIDTLLNIHITDGINDRIINSIKQDSTYHPIYHPIISWDSLGNLYHAEGLNVIKLDTETLKRSIIYTLDDTIKICSLYRNEFQLAEGNIVNGKYGMFILNIAGISNEVVFCDFINKKYSFFLSNPDIDGDYYASCQAALSYDLKYVSGTYFGHKFLEMRKIFLDTFVVDSTLPEIEMQIWMTRFFKFDCNIVSNNNNSHKPNCSHIFNFYTGDTVLTSDYQIWDYIPQNINKIEKTRVISTIKRPYNNHYYDIRGRRLYAKPTKAGVYFHNYKKLIILK